MNDFGDIYRIEFGYEDTRRYFILVEGAWTWVEIHGIFSQGLPPIDDINNATHYRLFREGEYDQPEWIELTDSARSELEKILEAGFSPVPPRPAKNKWVKTTLLLKNINKWGKTLLF